MTIALAFLLLAAIPGGYLAMGYLGLARRPSSAPMIGLVHAALGAAGLIEVLIAADHRTAPAPFRLGAELLLAAAIVLGLLAVFAAGSFRQMTGLVVATHATAAIVAIVLVSAMVVIR